MKLLSPVIDVFTADLVKMACIRRSGVNIVDGEMIYCITNGSLEGSFDSRISVRVLNESDLYGNETDYRVLIEGSLHKAVCGHNVFGGPVDLVKTVEWFIKRIGGLLGVELPDSRDWELRRVDVAYCFGLGTLDAVLEWFQWFKMANYPKRKPSIYYGGIYFPGQTTTLKFYSKGLEFKKHDKKRLSGFITDTWIEWLQTIANGILRVEVEVRGKLLKKIFNGYPLIRDLIGYDGFEKIYENEVNKVLKDHNEEVEKMRLIVRKSDDVVRRLNEVYNKRLSSSLLGTWFKLTTLGYERTLVEMCKATFYRHVNQLKEAGISWNGSDVVIGEVVRLVPDSFQPLPYDDLCIHAEFLRPEGFLVA